MNAPAKLFNPVAASALGIAIRRKFAMKYDLVSSDEHGRGIYRIPPDQWDESDLMMAEAWDQWFNSKRKTQDELVEWLVLARDNGVNIDNLKSCLPKEEGELPVIGKITPLKIAGGIAAGFALRWLFSGPKVPEVQAPAVDVEAVNQAIRTTVGS